MIIYILVSDYCKDSSIWITTAKSGHDDVICHDIHQYLHVPTLLSCSTGYGQIPVHCILEGVNKNHTHEIEYVPTSDIA